MSNEPQEVSLNKEDIEKIRAKIQLFDHKLSVAEHQYRQTVTRSKDRSTIECPEYEDAPKVADEQLRATLFQELDDFEKHLDTLIKYFEMVCAPAKEHH